MGVEQTTALEISCDNPECPGNDLDPANRNGWIFVSSEIYGQETQQSVFCSSGCVSTASASAGEDEVFAKVEEE